MAETTPDNDLHLAADLIAAAIEAERKAAWFYQTMAEMTADRAVKETLYRLSDDESSHAETLTRLYIETTGHEVGETPRAAVEGEPDPFDFPSASRRAALEFALKNEIKAEELYRSQAEVCDDSRLAEIFRRLAETENEHAAYLRQQLGRRGTQDGP
jgi:rubrerythrin